ncbi:MAG: hypothetical protein M1838_005382 [Thelocarpon superellum]|nr:MAG: hypothetical protein M1838_005382 [Thelocarpon superellum]
MSHTARTGILIDALVEQIVGNLDKRHGRHLASLKESAVQKLNHHPYGRTNHFDIADQLDGLEEKLHILNRDDLATALRARRDELSRVASKWTPEILALLLQLSDQPAAKSTLGEVQAVRRASNSPSLTWDQIVADDPLTEPGVWDNIDHAADSSDEEGSVLSGLDDASLAPDGHPVSVDDDAMTRAEACTISDNELSLADLQTAQFWRQPPDAHCEPAVAEIQAIREVLFMLSGVPTSLYRRTADARILVNDDYELAHVSPETARHVLMSFADDGTAIETLRQMTRARTGQTPTMQTVQAAVEKRLRHFDRALTEMHQTFLTPAPDTIVSLMEVHARLQSAVRPLRAVAQLGLEIQRSVEPQLQDFNWLERLFDRCCISQATGDQAEFAFMTQLFFECFQTYAKPVRQWMREGVLRPRDCGMFIHQTAAVDDAHRDVLWHEWFTLRSDDAGRLYAPRFIYAAADQIVTTGKSLVFLQHLDAARSRAPSYCAPEASLDLQSLCPTDALSSLAPFAEMFNVAFDAWIAKQHHTASATLRQQLCADGGLWRSLDALEHLYLFADGHRSGSMATVLFDKLDRGQDTWHDRFLTTELFQTIFGSLGCVDAERVTVRSVPGSQGDLREHRRSVQVLQTIVLDYRLPWPMRNILTAASQDVYQRIFTFLLQVRRARSMLERLRLLDGPQDRPEAALFFSIRHRLLWFASTLYTYLTEVVLAAAAQAMRRAMAAAAEVDSMIKVHREYVLRLERQCLLSKPVGPLHNAVISLLDLAILLSDMPRTQRRHAGAHVFDVSNRSISVSHAHRRSSPDRRPSRRARASSEGSDSSDDADDDQADPSHRPLHQPLSLERLRQMRRQFARLCGFVTVGLRGVARAATDDGTRWTMLAERLEWGEKT